MGTFSYITAPAHVLYFFGVKMRGTNKQVVQSWIESKPMGHSSGRLQTDGYRLTSYNLVIGATVNGDKIVGDYTSVGGDYVTQTTSEHIGLVKNRSETTIVEPSEFTRLYAAENADVERKQRHSSTSASYQHKQWQLQTQGDYR